MKKDRPPQCREGLSPLWSWEEGEPQRPLSSGGAQGSGGQLHPRCSCGPTVIDAHPFIAGGEAKMSQQRLSGPEPTKTLFTAQLPMQTSLEGETAGTLTSTCPSHDSPTTQCREVRVSCSSLASCGLYLFCIFETSKPLWSQITGTRGQMPPQKTFWRGPPALHPPHPRVHVPDPSLQGQVLPVGCRVGAWDSGCGNCLPDLAQISGRWGIPYRY